MPPVKRKINTKAILRIYWEHTKNHPWLLFLSIAGVLLAQVDKIIGPVYLKEIFNLLASGAEVTMAAVTPLLTIFAALSIVGWAGGRLEMWTGYILISKASASLVKAAYEKLMRHSYTFFTNSFTGGLTRRVSRFGSAYENLYYSFITVLFEAAVYVVGITAVLWYHNWIVGSVVFFWVLLFIFLQWWMSGWQRPLRLARATEDSNLTAALADSVSNHNTVTLFSGNEYENKIVGAAADAFQKAQQRSWSFNTLVYGIQGVLAITLNIGILWLAVSFIQRGVLTTGDLILIQIYVLGIFNTVWSLGRQFQMIHTSLADATEMIDTIELPLGVKDKKGAKKLQVKQGEVWFDDVTFRFHDKKDVLGQFSLRVAGGEKIALVGPSGAGKSTITKLLLRFYDIEEGRILIDGQDISQVTQDSLRDAIAFVPQEPILFHRTLMENIRYGRREASNEEVVAAAKAAHCHEFIDALPLGYDTYVGERGIKLSGGERQRVAIARAILKNAPILVLDEATSSLDSESEAYIQDALETLMQGKTVITVAHRLSTIMKMDRIVVMEQGRMVAQGTHLELIRERGLYQKLWSIQAGGFLGDGEKSKDTVEEDIVPLADDEEEK